MSPTRFRCANSLGWPPAAPAVARHVARTPHPAPGCRCTTSRLAQLVERKTLNLVVVGSSPTVGGRTSLLVGWPSGPRRWF